MRSFIGSYRQSILRIQDKISPRIDLKNHKKIEKRTILEIIKNDGIRRVVMFWKLPPDELQRLAIKHSIFLSLHHDHCRLIKHTNQPIIFMSRYTQLLTHTNQNSQFILKQKIDFLYFWKLLSFWFRPIASRSHSRSSNRRIRNKTLRSNVEMVEQVPQHVQLLNPMRKSCDRCRLLIASSLHVVVSWSSP